MLLLQQQTQEVTYHHFSLCRFGLLAESEQDLVHNLVLSLQGVRGKRRPWAAAGDNDDDDDDNRRETAGCSVADW